MRTSWNPEENVLGFTKLRREIEPRWVSWYIKEYYPDAEVRLRCPLGPVPLELQELYGPAKAAKVYRPSRPEIDALVILPGALVLIEAKIFKYMDGLAKLPVYKALVPKSAELKVFSNLPVLMHLLIPKAIPWVVAAAPDMGVEVKTVAPDWLLEIWEERDKYWQPEARMKRAERKALLGKLGFR